MGQVERSERRPTKIVNATKGIVGGGYRVQRGPLRSLVRPYSLATRIFANRTRKTTLPTRYRRHSRSGSW